MIRFESIQVQNFAIYSDVRLSISVDAEHPLTLIRGENESGKTTLMRAFLWVLFGKEALPKISNARHPVRPVWAKPGERITSAVDVRFYYENGDVRTHYRLSRSIDTNDNGNVVTQEGESQHLLRRDGSNWAPVDDDLPLLMKRLFRPEMRDFYFIDADKAIEFAGGPEGRHSEEMMRGASTQAIRALLGLEVILKTSSRLEDRRTNYYRQVGSQSSSAHLRQLSNDLDKVQKDLENTREHLETAIEEEQDLEKAWRLLQEQLSELLSKLGVMEGMNARIDKAHSDLSLAKSRQNQLVNELSQCLDDERFYSGLFMGAIHSTINELQPLKNKGYLPPAELTLLPRLLERGQCVCGVDFNDHPENRRHIERQIDEAKQINERGHFLDSVLETARRAGNQALGVTSGSWRDYTDELRKQLAALDPSISKLNENLEILQKQRDESGSSAVYSEIRKQNDELQRQLENARDRRKRSESLVADYSTQARSLSERIRTAELADKRTQHARSCAEVADDLCAIIKAAYNKIETEQVKEVSNSMNSIFRAIISATDESLFSEVGVRKVAQDHSVKQYELYVLQDGREKPMALANGASRRAIGISFILALAKETRTKVPLVADSLLHAMSGSVKRNLVEYLTNGQSIGQPVLFGLRSDFLDAEVGRLLKQRAGITYTLTSQSHVGGDVVRVAESSKHSNQIVVCDCKIDEYCQICERVGDEENAEERRLHKRINNNVIE